MIYKVRYFLGVLFVLLAGLAAIFHNEGLLQASLRVLEVVCGGTSEPVSPSTPSWPPLPTQGSSQGMGGPSSATSTVLLSAPSDTWTQLGNGQSNLVPYSGFWSSSKEEHLTFICSSTSLYPGRLWLNGGMRLLQVQMTDTCRQELESKLCTMVAMGPSATQQSTLLSWNKS